MKERMKEFFQNCGYSRINVLAVILAVIILFGIVYVWEDMSLYHATMQLREDYAEQVVETIVKGTEIDPASEKSFNETIQENLQTLSESTDLGEYFAKNDLTSEGRVSNEMIMGAIIVLALFIAAVIIVNVFILFCNMLRICVTIGAKVEDEYKDDFDVEDESEFVEEDDDEFESEAHVQSENEVKIEIVENVDELLEKDEEDVEQILDEISEQDEEEAEDATEEEHEEEEEFDFQEIGYSNKESSTKKTIFGCTRLFGGKSPKKVSEED